MKTLGMNSQKIEQVTNCRHALDKSNLNRLLTRRLWDILKHERS